MSGFTDSQNSQSTVGAPSDAASLPEASAEIGEGSTSAALSWMLKSHNPNAAAPTSAVTATMIANRCLIFVLT